MAESADWGRGDGDAEGEDAALFAAHHAKQKGQTNEAMFAELTRAEKEYEQSHIGHGVVHGQPGNHAGGEVAGTTKADSTRSAPLPAAPPSAPSTAPDPPAARNDAGRKQGAVDDKLRDRARERLLKALHGNAHAGGLSHASRLSFVHEAEQQACDASTLRATYFSKIGIAATRLSSQTHFGSIDQVLPQPAVLQPGVGLPAMMLSEAEPSFVA